MKDPKPRWSKFSLVFLALGLLLSFALPNNAPAQTCSRTVVADVVVLDQNYFINRLGAMNNLGMIYALKHDVYENKFDTSGNFIGKPCKAVGKGAVAGNCTAGNVVLRPDKRPRPIALRVSKGDCLQINFTNLLNPVPLDTNEQSVTRDASAHVTGLPLVGGIGSDGSWVGRNTSSLTPPGGTNTYTYYASDENVFMITNMANTNGSEGHGGSLTFGLYGVVIVEPGDGTSAHAAEYYRSHVDNEVMNLATTGTTADGHPIINYNAVYPNVEPFITENKAGTPVLNMQCTQAAIDAGASCVLGELIHSDIHAVITGPGAGKFIAGTTYPSTATNPRQDLPFRETASVFGDEQYMIQAFPFYFNNPVLFHTMNITKDGFVINYAGGGIGPEIISNRLGVGPTWDCPECKAEEFFLTSWALGDVGMWVDIPANGCVQSNPPLVNGIAVNPDITPFTPPNVLGPDGLNPIQCNITGIPSAGVKANVALFPDDPSTIHHAYIRDHFKFRNIHAGPFEHHIFHLHNNQWVFSPKSDNANYMDMQQIGPGGSYTMDITNEGAGNRNANPGDAIYHCHFYPHFAQGMWSDLRMHDVFEAGTVMNPLTDTSGVRLPWSMRDADPAEKSRAYPDGEVVADPTNGTCVRTLPDGSVMKYRGLCTGSPVVGIVPLPHYPMAPMPAVAYPNPADPRRIKVEPNPITGELNPGFPFYMTGNVAGHRPSSPPLDIACLDPLGPGNVCPPGRSLDGGLPRHVITGGTASFNVNRYDLNKELLNVVGEQVPENGTTVEQASFAYQGKRCHDTFYSDGSPATCDAALNNQGKKFRGGFITNGSNPRPGAPHSDPCVDNEGNLLIKGFTPKWNKPGCSLARLDNPDGPGCTGFTLPRPVEFGASPNTAAGGVNEPNLRPYKISNIQIDLVLNKKGWHFPQQRIIALWGDISDMYAGKLAPAPMVFRLNTLDCTEVWHSNLVPNFYEMDDFQVRTPTDIIAQHSHMTKFDVASSDGAANLWNYEDGTMSPGEIVERITAINANGGLITSSGKVTLTAKTHPFLEGKVAQYQRIGVAGCNGQTCGSRTTVQRWLADPVLNNRGIDRGIGNVFTHDHFGPSTFQQLGLYATILAEPAGSVWRHNETNAQLATHVVGGPKSLNADGGPTSWQAIIIPPANSGSFESAPYREFFFELSDFQQAYKKTWSGVVDSASFLQAVGPMPRDGDFVRLYTYATTCPGPSVPGGALPVRPCPMAIGGADQGTEVVNYRNEPVGARVFDPVNLTQAAGVAGDLAYVYASIPRKDLDLNVVQPSYVYTTKQCPSCTRATGEGYTCTDPPFCNAGITIMNPTPAGIGAPILSAAAVLTGDVGLYDPATPMMRLYEGDRVKIRAQVGATEESHHFAVHGVKWLMNYADPNSGWRNFQSFGISEQFQFNFPVLGDLLNPKGRTIDYLYSANMSNSGLWNGEWGLMRVYPKSQGNLAKLPNNIVGRAPIQVVNKADFSGICPKTANVTTFDVTAIRAQDIPLPTTVKDKDDKDVVTLIYNTRPDVVPANTFVDPITNASVTALGGSGPLHDPTAILYVLTTDLPGLRSGAIKPEPLILRANAGDCVQVNLTNALPPVVPDLFSIALTLDGVIDLCKNDDCTLTANNAFFPGKATFNVNDLIPSSNVGLHTQLAAYDVFKDDGVNVGQNVADAAGVVQNANVATVAPGGTRTFTYYAGDLNVVPVNQGARVRLEPRPIEFGVLGLSPADKIKQSSKGMKGALVIEPAGAICTPDPGTKAQADCTGPGGTYRDFVVVMQSDVNMKFSDPDPDSRFQFRSVPGFPAENPAIGVADDSEDSGVKAFNYKSDPYWFRLLMAPTSPKSGPGGQQTFATDALYSNSQLTPPADPQTPIFTAPVGTPVRFHFVDPAGNQRSQVPVIHGHAWQRMPYLQVGTTESAVIGDNPQSQIVGAQEGVGPGSKWDFIPQFPAGGPYGVSGDYLFRMQNPQGGYQGYWGLFRVQ